MHTTKLSSSIDPSERAIRITGTLYMLTAGIFFAANVLLLRAFATDGSAWLSSGIRFLVGGGICLFLSRREGKQLIRRVLTQRNLIVRGLVGGVGVVCFYSAIPGLGAGKATFIQTSYVVLGPICAVFMLGETFNFQSIMLAFLAFVGMFLMSGAGISGWEISPSFMLAIAAAILSAWAVVMIRQLSRTETSSTIFAAQCVHGLLICIVPATMAFAEMSFIRVMVLIVCGFLAAGGQLLLTIGFRYLSVAQGCLLNV